MRLISWRGIVAALVGVTVLSCVDSMTGPAAKSKVGATANIVTPSIVISQLYGGGGNAGATLKNDFIELFNPGGEAVPVTGWSVQYASSTGTTWQVTALTGTIPPGGYYLVQESQGAGGTITLPTPDATGAIAMAATAGKVILVTTTSALSGACPAGVVGAEVVDKVSFGTAASDCGFNTTATLANTTAAIRKEQGCLIRGTLLADFVVGAPSPRNSASPTHVCPPPGPLDHIVITGPNAVTVGSTISLSAELLDAAGHHITDPVASFTWASADDQTAHIVEGQPTPDPITIRGQQPGGPIAITVSATSNGVLGSNTASPFTVTVSPAAVIVPSTTFVSEIHYDNVGTDAGETIEIEGDAGTSLDGWSLVLFNGTPGSTTFGVYATVPLAGQIPATCGARGVLVFPFAVNGIQNGPADGWALINRGQVTELNSYGGTFTATDAPLAGLTSTDIGPQESNSTTPIGRSLQRAGNGVWFGPNVSSFGACNPALPPAPTGSVTVIDGKTDLAFAMQTQFFFGGTNLTGQPVTSVVWSTSDAAIITVDEHGIVTGKGIGSAKLIATAPDGAIGTVDITIHLAPGSTGIRLGHNTEFGEPTDANPSDDFLIHRSQYTVSYNPQHGGANWVSWNLDATHIGDNGRCPGTCYSADTALSNANLPALTTADWVSNSPGVIGYDRGHMAPSADWTSSEADNNTTFFLSNFLPQRAALNQGPWEVLEEALRDSVSVAHGSREAYIIAGGVFNNGDGLGSLLGKGKVFIPNSTYKIAIITPAGAGLNSDGTLPPNTTVMAVNMPNIIEVNADWTTYLTTVADIERQTGYNFLSLITESVQCRVEKRNCAPTAHITSDATGQVNEGQTVTFSGATSTDPDGDALNMTWTVNGASAGTGPSISFTFANDGLYLVELTVNDNAGGVNIISENVSVQNVAPAIGAFAGATLLRGETYTASGSFTDPGPDSWTGTVDFGDGTGTPSIQLTNKNFSLAHTYTSDGSFTVTVSVNDGEVTSTRTANVSVHNVAPAIGAFAGATLLRGETYTASGSFTDPGPDSWTGTVDFGDGTGTPSIQLTNKSFSLAHTYTSAGSFTVTVSVNDGEVTSTRSAAVEVRSTLDGINDLITAVEALPLNRGQTNSLQESLRKAIKRLEDDKGKPEHAVRELESFIREIQEAMRSGRIDQKAGSEIVAYAQRVIASITAP